MQRKGHFMPEALLRSQFAALETPDASEGDIVAVDITPDVATIVAQSLTLLTPQPAQGFRHDYRYLKRRRQKCVLSGGDKKALQVIALQDPHALPPGKYTVDGDNLLFTVVEGQTHPLTEQRPEYHRQYIDIHIVLAGVEIIGA
jgi:hypothetical protein